MAMTLSTTSYGRTSRTPRRPQHTFAVVARPWQIVPFMIAPVLPGETMKNLLFQARVVTDPIVNPLIGWWAEFYFFYVKHRDLDEPMRTNLTEIMIDPSKTIAPQGTNLPDHYVPADGGNYMGYAVGRCVATYFRDENETSFIGYGGYYTAQISQRSALDSALLESAYTAGAPGLVVGADDTITGQELDATYLLWQQYRASNITQMTYEEYLATYGIPLPAGGDSMRRPELVRYVKDWSYPVNTVDPVTGTPSSAVSWAIAERADKDRFFREPGFLIGLTCIRPKCYLKNQAGSVTELLRDALAWLPAVLGDNASYSVRKYGPGSGPYNATSAEYRVDLKDLYLYGDQYTNTDPNNVTPLAKMNAVALPTATMGKKYPSATDADSLFKVGTSNKIRMDGVVSLNILGMQVDTSATQGPGGF